MRLIRGKSWIATACQGSATNLQAVEVWEYLPQSMTTKCLSIGLAFMLVDKTVFQSSIRWKTSLGLELRRTASTHPPLIHDQS